MSSTSVPDANGSTRADRRQMDPPHDAKISVVLPVKNVAGIVRPCLESLSWADEILLVDGQSTDGTLQIAAEFPNVRVVQHPSKDVRVLVQANEPQASHPWILWFCADEVCDPSLGDEIRARVRSAPPDVSHFYIPSKVRQFGVDLGQGEPWPRLWRKGTAKFPLRQMHEMPEFVGRSETLANSYWHVDNPNIRALIPKFLRYEYVDARHASDEACAKVNSSFFYQLARFNYYSIRFFWPNRKHRAAGTLLGLTFGMGQLIRHLMLIDENRIRKGETIRDSHGWE